MMILYYFIIVISIAILWLKVKQYGLNLLRFNFAIFIIISLIPFTILYPNYFNEIKSYYIYKLFFTLIYLLLIFIDISKINANKYSSMDIQLIKSIGYLSVSIIMIFVFSVGPQNFPLFHVLTGSYKELILMREDSYKNANIPQILFYLIFYVKYFFIPLYVSLIMLYWRFLKHKLIYIILLIMVVNQLLTLSKTALFLMILSAILTRLYLTKITLRKVMISFIIITVIPLAILYLIVSDRELLTTLGALGNRVFLIPENSALDYYHLYLQGDFRDLTSSKIFALFNQNIVTNIQNYVFLKMYPNSIIKTGTSPGNIFGMAYVDLNLYLIPLYHILILLFIYWLNRIIIKMHSHSVYSFMVSASMGLSFIYFTNFPTVLNSYGIIFIILLVTLIRSKQINSYRRKKI